jgi:hypothetical protein
LAKKIKADHRADTRGKRWAGIPHAVLDSLAYLHCDLWERAVLVELVRAMNGYNNGSIALSQRQIAERLRSSNFKRIGRSIAGLMEKGLIDVETEGQWKERMARQYRLTFVNTGSGGRHRQATNDYRNWAPEVKSGAEPVSAERAKSAEPASAEHPSVAEPVSAGLNEKLRKLPLRSAEPVSSLISKPYPSAQLGGCGWWSSDRVAAGSIAVLGSVATAAGERLAA